MISGLFVLSGAAVGAAQVALIARTARRGPSAASWLVRFALVGLVLFVAARAGHLAWGVLGWLVGFVVTSVIVHRRLR